ncbi:TrkH family potassium uptake protein [Meiothermus granaticius]|uniref:Trk system potassium uptake protein TrkG n=1 Tax=Meiothermus granaticius NBRC 107808 TaxID=1227551 RepID=A0A399FCD7_9DEIN|nr:TrkH family potassium uptake protein [Meiothermus granaticius]MCL6526554.1 TrkH family potassium uptake protein [Thermaceae bacterium]RIH93883.1 Trk system potassium uptake protein TrkG [Meiothermus granaticius NBRC 107808]GEM86379.1 potassium transporter TrkG [Meiothermus granaticius NBRC 107808]
MQYSSRLPERYIPKVTLFFLGTVYLSLGVILLLLAVAALALREPGLGFGLGALLGIGLGVAFRRAGRGWEEPSRAEALLSVVVLWAMVPPLGAFPYWFSGGMPFLNGLFEATAGFTTSGASTLGEFSSIGYTLLLYRNLSQWLGGLGILVLLASVLTLLGVAGRQIFLSENTGLGRESLTPRLRSASRNVAVVYGGLTLLAAVAYALAGVPSFEAVGNALSTLSTGGFSPNPYSFETYPPLAQWMGTLFMFLGGANFLLQYRFFFRRDPKLLGELEFRVYSAIILIAGLGLTLLLYTHPSNGESYSFSEALRHAFFNVTSYITTTGFRSTPLSGWAPAAQAILLALMFVGGCAGSSTGGIRVLRWLVIGALVRRELLRSVHPQAVVTLRIGGRPISEDVMRSVAAFITLYVGLLAASTLVISVAENNFVLGFTAAAQAIGNAGPGLGLHSYADLHPLSKIVLMIQMWAGRIELIPVFLLLTPELWKRLRG